MFTPAKELELNKKYRESNRVGNSSLSKLERKLHFDIARKPLKGAIVMTKITCGTNPGSNIAKATRLQRTFKQVTTTTFRLNIFLTSQPANQPTSQT